MEFNGTEGKWYVDKNTSFHSDKCGWFGISCDNKRDYKQLAESCHYGNVSKNEAEANAHLIAAAPELLEAAIRVIEWTNENISKTKFAILRQAINKALNK